jgi:hypothetical protein
VTVTGVKPYTFHMNSKLMKASTRMMGVPTIDLLASMHWVTQAERMRMGRQHSQHDIPTPRPT